MPQQDQTQQLRTPALLLVGALLVVAGLTVFVVDHYRHSSDATSVLGVVLPAVTGVIAGVAGYHAGSTNGQSKGRAEQADHVRQTLTPLVRNASRVYESLASKVEAAAEAPAGESQLRLSTPDGTDDQVIEPSDLAAGRQSLSELNGFLNALWE